MTKSPVQSARKRLLVVLIVGLLSIQVIRPERTAAPSNEDDAMPYHVGVSPQIEEILDRSCSNCHSESTVWPWYSHIAPASWWIVGRVQRAREAMNLSNWASYDSTKSQSLVADICAVVRDGVMPDAIYSFLHSEVRMTPEETDLICAWSDATLEGRGFGMRQHPGSQREHTTH